MPTDEPWAAIDAGREQAMREKVNTFPPKWIGLWRVKQSPYYYKDTWAEAPLGDRWRAHKARMRALPGSRRNATRCVISRAGAVCVLHLDHEVQHDFPAPSAEVTA
jgi:hypothetical protein